MTISNFKQQETIKYIQGQVYKARANNTQAQEELNQIKKDQKLVKDKIKNKEKDWLILQNTIKSNIALTARNSAFALEFALKACGEYDGLDLFRIGSGHNLSTIFKTLKDDSVTFNKICNQTSFNMNDIREKCELIKDSWYLHGGYGEKQSGVKISSIDVNILNIEEVIYYTTEILNTLLILINTQINDTFNNIEDLKIERFNNLLDLFNNSDISNINSDDNLFLQCRIKADTTRSDTYYIDIDFDYIEELYSLNFSFANPNDDTGMRLHEDAKNDGMDYKNLMWSLVHHFEDLADCSSGRFKSNYNFLKRGIKDHINQFCKN